MEFFFSWMQLWKTAAVTSVRCGSRSTVCLLYNSLNCLGMNALQRLIHKINWPEIHWSCRQTAPPFLCLTLSPALASSSVHHKHTRTQMSTDALVFFWVFLGCSKPGLMEGGGWGGGGGETPFHLSAKLKSSLGPTRLQRSVLWFDKASDERHCKYPAVMWLTSWPQGASERSTFANN